MVSGHEVIAIAPDGTKVARVIYYNEIEKKRKFAGNVFGMTVGLCRDDAGEQVSYSLGES